MAAQGPDTRYWSFVDPLGDYNTDNSTSWVANDAGAKCTYLPGAAWKARLFDDGLVAGAAAGVELQMGGFSVRPAVRAGTESISFQVSLLQLWRR